MTPKVKFTFDKQKDLDNIWRTANKESKFMDFSKSLPPKVIEIAQGKEFEECQKELLEYYSKVYNSKIVESFLESVEKSWNEIESEYFKRLTAITGKSLDVGEIEAWVTLSQRCPYNPNNFSFFVSFYSSIPTALATVGHEVMHLHFHKYYWKEIENKIGPDKTADLKEALTVLLNKEFYDLWFISDMGYESHQKLRTFISETWEKEKDFDKLLIKCVDYLKLK